MLRDMQKILSGLVAIGLVSFSVVIPARAEESLKSELDAKAKAAREKTPAEIRRIMEKALEDVRKTKIAEKAKKKGAAFPSRALKNLTGDSVDLSKQAAIKPVIVVFYRGGWCPYCMAQLKYWNGKIDEVKAKGAEFYAVTPEKTDEAKKTSEKNEWKFPVLVDEGSNLARDLGIVYPLPQDLIGVYRKFGIDLEKTNTSEQWELPISATYVVGTDGKIAYAHIDPDYKKRAEPSEVLKKVPAAASGKH